MFSIFRSKAPVKETSIETVIETVPKKAPIRRFSCLGEMSPGGNKSNREKFDLSYDNASLKSAKSFKATPKTDNGSSDNSSNINDDAFSIAKSVTSSRSRSKSISVRSIQQSENSACETDDGSDFRLITPLEAIRDVAVSPVHSTPDNLSSSTVCNEYTSCDNNSVQSIQKSIETKGSLHTMTLETNAPMSEVTFSNSGVASSPHSDITQRSPWEQNKPYASDKPSIIGIPEREYVSYVQREPQIIPFHINKREGPSPVYIAGLQDVVPKVRQRYFTPDNKEQYKHFVYPPKNPDAGKTSTHLQVQLGSLMNPGNKTQPREPRDFRSSSRSRSNSQCNDNTAAMRARSSSRSPRNNVETEITRLKSENIDLYYKVESLKLELQSLSQSSIDELNELKSKQQAEIERIQNEFQSNQISIRQSIGTEAAAADQLTGLMKENDETLVALQIKFDDELSVLKLQSERGIQRKEAELTATNDKLTSKASELNILNKLLMKLESELVEHKLSLSSKDSELLSLSQSLSSKGAELAELQETVINQSEEQNILKQLLATKNSNLAALELALENIETNRDGLSMKSASQSESIQLSHQSTQLEIDSLNQKLQDKEHELETLNQAYLVQEKELFQLKESILTRSGIAQDASHHSSATAAAATVSAANEKELVDVKAYLEKKESEIRTLKNMLSCQDLEVIEMKECLQAKDDELSNLQQLVDAKDEDVASLQQAIENKEDELIALNEQLNQKDFDYEESITTQERQLASLNQQLTDKITQIAALKDELLNQEDIHLIHQTLDNKNVEINSLNQVISKQAVEIDSLKQTVENQLETVCQHEQNAQELKSQLTILKYTSESSLRKITQETSQEISSATDSLHAEYKVKLSDQAKVHNADLTELQTQYDALLLTTKQFKSVYTKEYKQRKAAHNKLLEINGNIRVVCRVRPILEIERSVGKGSNIAEYPEQCNDEIVINRDIHLNSALTPRIRFEYDRVFQPSSSQKDVFEAVQPLCVSVLDGYNVCIFAYGQTGSGKTYTMEGSLADPGVVPRAICELFNEIANLQHIWVYEITFSLLEIYNENIFDLLALGDGKTAGNSGEKLDVRQTPTGNIVPGLTERIVTTPEQVNELMHLGQKNRAVGSHDMNERSSRSHSIVTLVCRGEKKIDNTTTYGKLHLIDLAGSERVSKTDASGVRLTEAQNINKSLSALGDVINALGDKKSTHTPYRNSKLTFLLQDSLGGNSKMLMFVAISPAVYNVGETLCSLNFASRCRNVELGQAKKQITSGNSELSSSLSAKSIAQSPRVCATSSASSIPVLATRNMNITSNSVSSITPRNNPPLAPPVARASPRGNTASSTTSTSSKSLKTVKLVTPTAASRCSNGSNSSKSHGHIGVSAAALQKSEMRYIIDNQEMNTDSEESSQISSSSTLQSFPLVNDEDSYA